MSAGPHIKPGLNTVRMVMLDVVIALLPLVFVAWLAYGNLVMQQFGTAIAAAFLAEFIFSALLLRKHDTLLDGSALVTALLLTFTISPITPWYITAFGAACAVLFGKIVWGGLGKNRFNPALVGREFMGVIFASVMSSPHLWKTGDLIKTPATDLFPGLGEPWLSSYLSSLVYKTSGAMGEYSMVAIAAGGLYLLLRNRITWHIPLALLASLTLLGWWADSESFRFSMAAVLFGTLFMATDMPSSPTTPQGKTYYGLMIGVTLCILIRGGVKHEYMSYSILLLNGFSEAISSTFRTTPWGRTRDWPGFIESVFLLTGKILFAAFAVLSFHYYGLTGYLLLAYVIYVAGKYAISFSKRINHAI